MAKKLKIKLEKNVIKKEQNNTPQSLLDKNGREKNVVNVYKIVNKQKILNKKILLIDDIFTIGATVHECSKMLKISGAKKVDVLTIAKD